MTLQSRRSFLLAAGGVSLGFLGVSRLLAGYGSAISGRGPGPYGPLLSDPMGLLDLPRGFTYRVLSRAGETMDDGLRVPGLADGMAAFSGPGGVTIVVRNHEVAGGDAANGAFGFDNSLLSRVARDRVYDIGAGGVPSHGGTTTLVYDTSAQKLERQYLSLAGTERNCAGGPTPWGSWLTCEEDVTRAGELGRARHHGYVFEVPAAVEGGLAEPMPLEAMGRFMHEAVAIDPRTGTVYLTEDRGDGLLYRFLPKTPGVLRDGGRLQALMIEGKPSFDTRNWDGVAAVARGETLTAVWIDLDGIDAPTDDLRTRGFAAGAARFARGEGIFWGNGRLYVVCTDGGRARKGQVWTLAPAESSAWSDRLTLFVEPNDGDVLDMPDNAAVAANGDLFLCEDGSGDQFVVGVTPEGELFKFARNAKGNSEFAGVCFSPDGTTMFVNIQHTGQTVAITGPWRTA